MYFRFKYYTQKKIRKIQGNNQKETCKFKWNQLVSKIYFLVVLKFNTTLHKQHNYLSVVILFYKEKQTIKTNWMGPSKNPTPTIHPRSRIVISVEVQTEKLT